MRLFKQTDYFRCGPYSVANAFVFYKEYKIDGMRINKQFIKTKLCEIMGTTKQNGTCSTEIEKILFKSKVFKYRYDSCPQPAAMISHVINGDAIVWCMCNPLAPINDNIHITLLHSVGNKFILSPGVSISSILGYRKKNLGVFTNTQRSMVQISVGF